jgi:hypothetical protein
MEPTGGYTAGPLGSREKALPETQSRALAGAFDLHGSRFAGIPAAFKKSNFVLDGMRVGN